MTGAAFIALTWLIAGCARDSAVGATADVLIVSADSATFSAPTDTARIPTWGIADRPEIDLGGGEQDPESIFYSVGQGRLFGDGSFVVADGGSHQLRFFSLEGRLTATAGRQGQGPNEFGTFGVLETVSDSVYVHDRSNDRVAVLDRAGSITRHIPVPSPSGQLTFPVGAFGDGALLLRRSEGGMPSAGSMESFQRIHLASGDSLRELGRLFAEDTYWVPFRDAVAGIEMPFGRIAVTIARGDEWFYTSGDAYAVDQYDRAGARTATYVGPGMPPPLMDADYEALFASYREEMGGRPVPFDRERREAPRRERRPGYDRLLVDHEGSIWARLYGVVPPQNCWHIFVRNRGRFARACFPVSFYPLDISATAILGVLTDQQDVEHVARYRLVK